ncbi:hypothetical protein [Flavobacterium undicola]|uniref:hypothetical protein n=1 Tax=Flavobacterium undicola TaxID=1932779 RepID=UPI0015E21B46|nr:hypothetical protein [Flavobacterium undicola]MBA0883500.1 hypothetical protein [Flavobacterium undicola]
MRVILIFLLFTTTLFSQRKTIVEIENELQKSYQKIQTDRLGNGTIAWDSLESDTKTFKEEITKYIATYPETLTYEFDSLKKENIDIVTSDDKLFRIYSWNTWLGGTMEDFENIFQYKSNAKVYYKNSLDKTTNEWDYIPFYSQIFTLKTAKKTYYLVIKNGSYSSKDASQSIQIYTIEDNNLIDSVKLIKTQSGLTNTIDISFDFFSVVDRPERPLELIKYDKENRIIYIPIVYENGKVTDRFILYKFNGEYFEHIETKKNKKVKK